MVSVERALSFLESQPRPVELAWARVTAGLAGPADLSTAISGYQNEDGGVGKGLEVDIKAPQSQPFAARLVMLAAIDAGISASDPVIQRLAAWLEREQDEDGCWRLVPALLAHPIAPWFQGWPFPSLNPALCIAGAARRLGIGSERLFQRVSALTESMAELDKARNGEFYDVLPFAEYFPWIVAPQREEFLDAIAAGVEERASSDGYEDAGHFFTHCGPKGSEISKRLTDSTLHDQLDRLEAEQEADGGWPSPYEQLWRCWATADALSVLKSYGRWS
jgi:hypothetical protein